MRKKYRIAVLLLTAAMVITGCASGIEETDKGSVKTEAGKTDDGRIETEIEEDSDSAIKAEAENIENGDESVEAITAWDVVKEMKAGWNLGNTLDSKNANILRVMPSENWETAWGNPVTTKELIKAVTAEGFNVIRIPVSWEEHLLIGENWKIEEGWLSRVQEVVDYAYEEGVYVILNTHHEDWCQPYYEKEENASKMLASIWSQLSERFKDYDEHLIFEGMNEPRKIGTSLEWNGGDEEGWKVVNNWNKVFIDTVRSSGGKNADRILMIPGYAANCWEALKHIEVPEDNKLIVSVHAYEPYEFALKIDGRGTWDQDTANIDQIMKTLDELFISKGIPVIIGEFGAMYKDAEGNEQERAAWAEYYIKAAKAKGIPCCWWDNGLFEAGEGEAFGLIDRQTCEWRYPLVIEGIKKGLE